MRHGDSMDDNFARADRALRDAAGQGAALALLPEYFFAVAGGSPGSAHEAAPLVRGFLARASREYGLAVAGNVIEPQDGALRNVGVVYDAGRSALEQRKIHPMPREAEAGVAGGDGLRTGRVRGIPTGVLVCSDVLYPEAARVLALQGARLLLNPVMSPFAADDDTKAAREAVYVARAYDAGAFVLKAGGHRSPPAPGAAHVGPPTGVAGRSLVAAPWGLLARYADDFEDALLVVDLDMARLERFREKQARFPARRPEAYGGIA